MLGVLDAVFLGEPGVLEARQRIAARMRTARGAREAASRRGARQARPALPPSCCCAAGPGAAGQPRAAPEPPRRTVTCGGTGTFGFAVAWPRSSSSRAAGRATRAARPRLFAAAGEHRQQLRNDLALQTAEDVASTLGTMKGVLMKLGQMASYIDNGLSPGVAPDAQPAAGQRPADERRNSPRRSWRPSSAGRRSRPSPAGTPSPSPRPRSGRCTGRSPGTAARSR